MRRLVPVVLLLLTAVGCRRAEEPKAVIKFAHAVTSGSGKPILEDAIREFEKNHPGIRIKQMVQNDTEYQKQGLQSLLQGGDPPDVFFEWAGYRVDRKVRDGYAADLTDVLKKDNWKDTFIDNAWNDTKVDGRYYMIPDSIGPSVLYWYNRKIIEKHHLSEPKSYEELIGLLRKLKAAGEVPVYFGNRDVWPMGNWGAHIVHRAIGRQLFDDTLRLKPGTSLAHPEFVRALKMIEQWAKEGFFNPGFMAITDADAMIGFFHGKGVFHPLGSWTVQEARASAPPGFEYGCFNLPPMADGKGDQTTLMVVTVGFMISKTTKHFELAVEFLRHLSSRSVQERRAASGSISPLKGVMRSDITDPHLMRVMEAIGQAKSFLASPDTGYPIDVANRLYDAIALVADGKADAETALKKAEEQVAPWRKAAAEKGR